jgi:galactose mutarotase-like enzyme
MQSIENEFFKVEVDEVGALLTSVVAKKDNQELLYQKDPRFWPNQDVVIFPQIGKSPFEIEGTPFDFATRHGFARVSTFKVIRKKADSLILEMRDTPETQKVYPFSFIFDVMLSLDGTKLIREAKITNISAKPIPFALGFHQAFRAKYDGTGSVHFDKAPKYYYPLRDGVLLDKAPSIYHKDEVLTPALWGENETWVLPNDEGYQIDVKSGFGYTFKYRFDAPEIAIWYCAKGGDFLCVEPWWGFGTYQGMPKEMSQRLDENVVEKSKSFRLEIEIVAD